MAEIWATVAVAAVAAGGTAYAANKSASAQKDAAAQLGNVNQLDLQQIPAPQQVDIRGILASLPGINAGNLDSNFGLANRVNKFNLGQALRGYTGIQPYFKQNQELIGRNVASFARGELPSDVVSSIGRAAAQRGFQGGFAGGLGAGGAGSALGGLNLRNLGLTSLQLSQSGTGMAMQANQQAASMAPGLFDPTSMFLTPNAALGAAFNNAGIFNDWQGKNTQIANAEITGNTELLNNVLSSQTALGLQSNMQSAQNTGQMISSLAPILQQLLAKQQQGASTYQAAYTPSSHEPQHAGAII